MHRNQVRRHRAYRSRGCRDRGLGYARPRIPAGPPPPGPHRGSPFGSPPCCGGSLRLATRPLAQSRPGQPAPPPTQPPTRPARQPRSLERPPCVHAGEHYRPPRPELTVIPRLPVRAVVDDACHLTRQRAHSDPLSRSPAAEPGACTAEVMLASPSRSAAPTAAYAPAWRSRHAAGVLLA